MSEKIFNCDWPESKKHEGQECSGYFVGIFDIKKGTVTRIKDSLYNSETQSWQKRDILNIHDGIVNNKDVYYGCYPSYPINIADLNQDGVPEVAMFSSIGRDDIAFSYSLRPGAPDPEGANATLYLSFLSAIHPDPYLLDTELVYNKYDYNKATGQRRYAKLYFADFDSNEKLDILVWRRFFNITPGPEHTIKQELVKEEFEHYEEAYPAYEQQVISNEDGQKLLKEHDWGWFDGFPSKNLCIAKDPWRHYAKPEIMQHGSIPTD